MSNYSFVDPQSSYPLPKDFDYGDYIEAEREFWALFPGTGGKRVNFCLMGLTAQLYIEVPEDGSDLKADETYFLMPCADCTMKPIRMKPFQRLTLSEYRMSHLTALKIAGKLDGTGRILDQVHMQILGPEIMRELQ